MKTLYLECNMGAAGDMLTSALLELSDNPERIVEKLNQLGIPRVKYIAENAEKCGVKGTHMRVEVDGHEEGNRHHDHHAHHSSLGNIENIVQGLNASEGVKADIIAVYRLIAEAESSVHGVPVEEIHFHEVGTLDAVADVAAVCLLIEMLSPEYICASPVNVGSGSVKCAHGILPVPAPATAYILRGVPAYSNEIKGELCTPTGAALLKHFVTEFKSMPIMKTEKIGCGMGKKDFPQANCVRAFFGETEGEGDTVSELTCNLDDMTGEEIGFALEVLLENGALDAFTVPVNMKKSRPAYLLKVLCKEESRENTVKLIFKHTSTLGIRECKMKRYTLEREIKRYSTPFGDVRVKYSRGCGTENAKPEYGDLARIARERDISLTQARELVEEYVND